MIKLNIVLQAADESVGVQCVACAIRIGLDDGRWGSLCCNSYVSLYVTGPAKTGHVGTNYTPSHNRSYLSIGIKYFHSVTCII